MSWRFIFPEDDENVTRILTETWAVRNMQFRVFCMGCGWRDKGTDVEAKKKGKAHGKTCTGHVGYQAA